MSTPTHKRRFQSDGSISIDDMIDWSDEEPMEEESSVPHLLGSLSVMDSFDAGTSPGPPPPPPQPQRISLQEGDDPLSIRDSVWNPSPLVLSVRKIYSDEDEHQSPTNNRMAPPPPVSMNTTMHTQAPRRVSEGFDMMVIDHTATHQTRPRGGSYHRRASANSLPPATDLEDVIRGFQVLA